MRWICRAICLTAAWWSCCLLHTYWIFCRPELHEMAWDSVTTAPRLVCFIMGYKYIESQAWYSWPCTKTAWVCVLLFMKCVYCYLWCACGGGLSNGQCCTIQSNWVYGCGNLIAPACVDCVCVCGFIQCLENSQRKLPLRRPVETDSALYIREEIDYLMH